MLYQSEVTIYRSLEPIKRGGKEADRPTPDDHSRKASTADRPQDRRNGSPRIERPYIPVNWVHRRPPNAPHDLRYYACSPTPIPSFHWIPKPPIPFNPSPFLSWYPIPLSPFTPLVILPIPLYFHFKWVLAGLTA